MPSSRHHYTSVSHAHWGPEYSTEPSYPAWRGEHPIRTLHLGAFADAWDSAQLGAAAGFGCVTRVAPLVDALYRSAPEFAKPCPWFPVLGHRFAAVQSIYFPIREPW